MHQRIAALALLASSLATPLAAQAPAGRAIEIAGKFDSATDHLLIPVAFGGSRVWCALDTGFSALMVVDRQKAAAIGLPIRPPLPLPDGTPPQPTDNSSTATVEVGPVSFGPRDIIIRDLPDEAPEMECVLGASVLRQFIIEMDYERPRVRLISHAAYTPAAGTVEVPLVFRSNPNVPFVRVVFRFADGTEQAAQLVADTGTAAYAALVVDPAAARMRRSLGPTAAVTSTPKGPSGPVQISAARPAALIVGGITMEQPVIALLESDFGSGGFDDGLLGCGFFRRFLVAFDFQGRRMLLRPNFRAAESHLFDASGAGLRQERESFVVDRVLPGTAAARAGLQVGDAITAVDGRTTAQLSLVSIRRALSLPGQTRTLRVRRGDQLITISLALTKRL